MSCTSVPRLDLSRLTCIEQCRQLYSAYMRMLAGGQKTQVKHGEFFVEYRANLAGDMDRLLSLYTQLRNTCPEAMAQLPDLSPGNRVRRGGPSTLRICG